MEGLIMDFELNVPAILRRGEQLFGEREIVTRRPDRSWHRYTYTDFGQRARRLAAALRNELGDQALDAFEKSVERKMADRIAANEHELAMTKARIEDLRRESARLESLIGADTEKWREWRRKKRSHVRDLARAWSYLIDRDVITTDADDSL